MTQAIQTAAPGVPSAAGACVNGKMQGTGSACADDAKTQMTCTDDGEAEDDGESGGEVADGKCVNGKDSVNGTACSSSGAADPANPMAVPDHNVPTEVGGCDNGEQED